MRWKEFKDLVESKGVNDETELFYEDMNFGGPDDHFDEWCIKFDDKRNQLRIYSQYWEPVD